MDPLLTSPLVLSSGACLPSIVPRLSEVLSDPHPKVQAAAQEALQEVGSVIRNPEVQTLVPSLLNAISDPNGEREREREREMHDPGSWDI